MGNEEKQEQRIIYSVNHRYRVEIIVPICAIYPNIGWLLSTDKKRVITTADGIKCEVVQFQHKNICELEEKVLSLYSITAWDFLKKWYATYPTMAHTEFVVMKLKKID